MFDALNPAARAGLLILAALSVAGLPAAAEDTSDNASTGPVISGERTLPNDAKGTYTFVWENDKIAGTDRNYTNGVRLSWLSGTQATDRFSGFVSRNVFGADEGAVIRRGLAIGHSIFTPEDTQTSAFLPDQHPYAGWLYGEITTLVEQRNIVDQVSVQLGVVGPSAGGEFVQNEFHGLIGVEEANGWENQLEDEVGVVVSWDRKLRRIGYLGSSRFGADFTPNIGVSAGNIYTHARAGLTVRVGADLTNDYGPPRVRPSLGGAGYFTPADNFSWYLFGGVEGRAVAHSIFTDGSLFNEDFVDLDTNALVADFQGGLVVQVSDFQFAFTYIQRTKEFAEQSELQKYGAFSFSQKF